MSRSVKSFKKHKPLYVFFFKHNFCVKPHVPREPRRNPSNRRLNEHGIYIRHLQDSNLQPVPSQTGADIPLDHSEDICWVYVWQFSKCIEEIDGWMQSNRLKMNTDKTQLIWIGTRQQLSKVDINEIELQLDTVSFSTSVSDLGVILDNQLKMADHVAALCWSCYLSTTPDRFNQAVADIRCQENASGCVRYK